MIQLRRPALTLCAIVVAIAASGCGSSSGTPTAAPVSDPNEIITRSAAGLAGVQTVHFDIAIAGSVNMGALSGLTGSGSSALSGSIKLDGASVTGDLDIAKRAYHVSASLPTRFGLTADLIQVDGYRYTKISTSGDKYTKSEVSTPLLPSAAPSATLDVADTVNQLKSSLNAAGAQATLVGRDKVDGRDAYHVTVNVPVDKLNQQIGATGGSAASGISVDTASFDYWVYVDSLQPAKLDVKGSSASLGSIDLTVTLTKYDQPVTITVPPDSEIQSS